MILINKMIFLRNKSNRPPMTPLDFKSHNLNASKNISLKCLHTYRDAHHSDKLPAEKDWSNTLRNVYSAKKLTNSLIRSNSIKEVRNDFVNVMEFDNLRSKNKLVF